MWLKDNIVYGIEKNSDLQVIRRLLHGNIEDSTSALLLRKKREKKNIKHKIKLF